MRLLALELQGFKSFPDRTRLEFGEGITAVVGPNGSGKSNIADAVRWALGEQSTKTLRSSLMEDVIFNGTQTRKPVGFAMVRLTLDNSRGKLEGFDKQVTVARRLYRSGESEYSIDGTQVRLRDVHELFMDTGLGRDGYSIIGQGKIAEIVSAKSNDRREIFEEAAGIAKYRYRRTDAERQLARAEENLVRLEDILGELEDRVEPLREQSEKAKRFLTLAEERKRLEISLWILELDQLRTKLKEHENKVLISKNDYEKLEAATNKLEEQLQATYQRMQELSVAADERRNLIRSLEEQQSEEKAQIAVLNNDISHNQESFNRIAQELEGTSGTRERQQKELEEKEKTVKDGWEELEQSRAKLSQLEQAFQKEKEEQGALMREWEETQQKKLRLEHGQSETKLVQATSGARLTESQNRLEETKKHYKAHQAAEAEYLENIEECGLQVEEQNQKLAALEQEKLAIVKTQQDIAEQGQGLEQKYASIAQEIMQKRSRLKLLEELEANMEGFAGSVRFIMRQHENGKLSGVHGTVSSVLTVENRYTTAIETALGGAMQNIIVEDERAARAGIERLKQSKAGRATFLPLTAVKGTEYNFSRVEHMTGFLGSGSRLVETKPEYSQIITRLLGRVCIADTLENATAIAKQAGYRFRIVTLDGQVINAGGSFTGGYSARSAGVLSRKVEIDQLVVEGKALRKQADSIQPEREALQQTLEKSQHTLEEKQKEIQQVLDERTRLGFSLEQLTRSQEQAAESRKQAKQELERLQEKLEEILQGESDSESKLSALSQELSKLEQTLAQLTQKRERQDSTLVSLQEQLSSQRMDEIRKSSQLSNDKEDLQRTKEQISLLHESHNRLEKEKTNLEQQTEEIRETIAELTKSTETIAKEVTLNNESIASFLKQRTNLEQGTTDLRKQERELATQREQVSRELVRLEERTHSIQGNYDGIIAKLWDEYELTRSAALEQAETLEDPDRSKRRLTEVRTKIRNLGSVNVDAIEEYKEVYERYTFLSEQITDVKSSKEQLLELIDELTEEMRTLFLDTFYKIDHEFAITFRELFGGGKAQLTLTDEEDVLDSGIEIHVQPPGKVIKNLSLLSGGEQSFVAIAIYFAILKVKPAPFVLLDEIEAALDDVNVVRYASYLRVMSEKTQCIAITHRRGTMEEADVLYGVTMQEEGVSKLLELNINEVESKLGMEGEI